MIHDTYTRRGPPYGRGLYAIATPEKAERFALFSRRSIPVALVGLCVLLDPLPHLGFEGLRRREYGIAWESEEVTNRESKRASGHDITGRSSLNNFATSGTSCQPRHVSRRLLSDLLHAYETTARHTDRRTRRQGHIPDCSGWGRSRACAEKE